MKSVSDKEGYYLILKGSILQQDMHAPSNSAEMM
jgi:hypothetical protein